MRKVKTIVVVNPHAGRQNILREIDEVQRILEESGREVVTVKTENAEQAEAVIRASLEEKPETLICCGGDGTLSQMVSEVLKAEVTVPIGYIPAGSTNDFANSLGLPKEPGKAARQIAEGSLRALDAGRFGERYFVYVASFGAFTQSSYSTTQSLKNSLGHLAYILEGIKELPTLKSYQVKVETAEGEVFEGDYIFGSLSNSTSFGGIVKLDSGKVDLADGKLELTLVKMPRNLLEMNRVIFSLMSGKYDEEMITFVHTRGAKFTCAEPMPWSLDGEYASGGEQVEAEALPQALQLYY